MIAPRLIVIVALLIFASAGASTVRGDEPTCNGNLDISGQKVGVVISNQAYPSDPLRTPNTDADAVYQALLDNGYVANCLRDLDQNHIENLESEITSKLFAFKGDIFIYLSGHGWNDGATNYFLSTSADLSNPTPAASLNLDRLVEDLSYSAAHQIVFVFDTCRSLDKAVGTAKIVNNIEAHVQKPKDIIVAYSAGFGTQAYELSNEYSPFGGSLAAYMTPVLGLSLQEIFELVDRNVDRLTHKAGLTQTPTFVSLSSRELFLDLRNTGLKGLRFATELGDIGVQSIDTDTPPNQSVQKDALNKLAQVIRSGNFGSADCADYFKSLVKGTSNNSTASDVAIALLPRALSPDPSKDVYAATFTSGGTCTASADGNSLISIIGYDQQTQAWEDCFDDFLIGLAMKVTGADSADLITKKYVGAGQIQVSHLSTTGGACHFGEIESATVPGDPDTVPMEIQPPELLGITSPQ